MNLRAHSKSLYPPQGWALAMLLFIGRRILPRQLSASYAALRQPRAVDGVVSLGDVPVGKATTQISLLNAHLSTVVIKGVGASCGCTAGQNQMDFIAPFRRGAILFP